MGITIQAHSWLRLPPSFRSPEHHPDDWCYTTVNVMRIFLQDDVGQSKRLLNFATSWFDSSPTRVNAIHKIKKTVRGEDYSLCCLLSLGRACRLSDERCGHSTACSESHPRLPASTINQAVNRINHTTARTRSRRILAGRPPAGRRDTSDEWRNKKLTNLHGGLAGGRTPLGMSFMRPNRYKADNDTVTDT
ncbi:hypothetical protein EVAR_3209_1 [Eumeta japonica]|uniref:Uncharacterized protein n=1 Tax=Eumeta variegata TaxID=151549 RepID=A0A4C1SXM8_EUMVA|nr:hypothetical protein EVAR_3209_1 [Eumeta japonica]